MQRVFGSVLILLAAAGFGTLAIFGKLGFDAGLNNPTMLTFRFVLASVLLVAFLLWTGRGERIGGRPLLIAILLGVAYFALSGGFFWGLIFIPAGLAAITLYTYPVYVYLLSVTILGERLTWLKLLAIAVTMVGVTFIIGIDLSGVDLRGIALVSLAAIAYAIYTTGSRHAVATIDADVLAAVAIAVTAVLFLIVGVVSGTIFIPTEVEQWAIIAGLALVGTAMPIALLVHGLELVEASRASILTMAEPPVTVILGIVILNEVLTVGILVGGTLILAGIVLIQRDQQTTRPAAGQADWPAQ